MVEMMDISPLPHKVPSSSVMAPGPLICEIEVESPVLMEGTEVEEARPDAAAPETTPTEPAAPVEPAVAPAELPKPIMPE